MLKKFYCVCLCAWAAGSGGETLTWNGTDGGAWDGTARNWMDEAGRPCAWRDGAEAVFAGSGCRVRAAKGVKAASVQFRASGVRLEGEAEIPVLIADGGTSNTMAFVDAAPHTAVCGGGMLVCAASARFGALDIDEGFVRIADDGVAEIGRAHV